MAHAPLTPYHDRCTWSRKEEQVTENENAPALRVEVVKQTLTGGAAGVETYGRCTDSHCQDDQELRRWWVRPDKMDQGDKTEAPARC